MATRKDGSEQNLEGRNSDLSREGGLASDASRTNDEGNLDTQEISSEIEEGDEDYDDEELDEDDFDVDEEDDLDDEEEDVEEDKDL